MKVVNKDINGLVPYEFNNKIHDELQINRIANSIKEFGFLQPIVIDKNNIVIIGHWRLEWAKKLWLKEVPVVIMEELSDSQIKKLRILDNKLNESEWDLANLKQELDELKDLNIGDLKILKTELFPELDAPEFNPDEYKNKMWCSLIIKVKDEWELEMLKKDLEELWYTNYK